MPSTVWQGRIAFGMVAIPVRLYRAARHERIRFHDVYRPALKPPPETPQPVKFDRPAAKSSAPPPPEPESEPEEPPVEVARVHRPPVAEGEILKGYEVQKDQYVVLERQEIARLRPRTSTELDIAEFVHLNEIDPVFFDASYYVAPDHGGEKPYAVLFRALQESGYVALGSFAMHGREHATVIRPGKHGLILHTMFYQNEVRSIDEYRTPADLTAAKEVELALMLVEAYTKPFEPARLKDTFEERLRELIDTRAQTDLAAAGHTEHPKAVPAVDIMEALRRSLAAAKKPAQPETKARATKRRKTG